MTYADKSIELLRCIAVGNFTAQLLSAEFATKIKTDK